MPACTAALTDLLDATGRGLLQYFGDVPPWTAADEADTRTTLTRLVASQQDSVADVAELLADRHADAELDAYADDLTRWNDLAFGFLIGRIVEDQRGVVAAADSALAACGPVAGRVLRGVREREAGHLAELERLAAGVADHA